MVSIILKFPWTPLPGHRWLNVEVFPLCIVIRYCYVFFLCVKARALRPTGPSYHNTTQKYNIQVQTTNKTQGIILFYLHLLLTTTVMYALAFI